MEHNKQFLIIGGTTKAATTSLFSYLSEHPEINPSTYKESRYFLDEEYPLSRKVMFSENKETYLSSFYKANEDKHLYLEATPDYLYSRKTPERLLKMFGKDVKVVFILRDPADRMNSWYRFAKQIGEIGDISFMEFIRLQKTADEGKQIERVLDQGNYSKFIKMYRDVLGAAQIKVVFYEEFEADEQKAMQEIAEFAGIDPLFYQDRTFERKNVTVEVKQNFKHKVFTFYRKIKRAIRKKTHDKGFHKQLAKISKKVEKSYYESNSKSESGQGIDPEAVNYLATYYQDEAKALATELNVTVPW